MRARGATGVPISCSNFLDLSPVLYCAMMAPVKFQQRCQPACVLLASAGRVAPVSELQMGAVLSQCTTHGCIAHIDSPVARLSSVRNDVISQRDRNRRKI